MFLALREIRFAKGRFALMTGVVALVTMLLVLLSALTRGLGSQSTSAVTSLPASHVLLAPSGSTTTWGDSVIPSATVARGGAAQPLLVTRARLTTGDDVTSVAVFGVDASSRAAAARPVALRDGEVVLPREVADTSHVAAGDHVTLNGTRLVVAAVEDTQWYSHSPVAWTTRATAEALGHVDHGQATALLVDGSDADATSLARTTGLTSMTTSASVKALSGYSSEHGSLMMIQGFLYGICALVVIAFLSVWTIQRTRDLAVLRAMGASRRYVLRDSLGQAALLLVVGAVLGGLVGTGIAWAASSAVPVLVLPTTTLAPAVGVAIVGVLGAVVATRRVTRLDPLLALGGN